MNDCVFCLVCLYHYQGVTKMTDFVLNMNVNNCAVTLEFYMTSDGPDWETMKVLALLPGAVIPETKHWVEVNDLLSEEDWTNIEYEIGWNYDELMRQKEARDY